MQQLVIYTQSSYACAYVIKDLKDEVLTSVICAGRQVYYPSEKNGLNLTSVG